MATRRRGRGMDLLAFSPSGFHVSHEHCSKMKNGKKQEDKGAGRDRGHCLSGPKRGEERVEEERSKERQGKETRRKGRTTL